MEPVRLPRIKQIQSRASHIRDRNLYHLNVAAKADRAAVEEDNSYAKGLLSRLLS
jgi:hypothetical protein